MNPLGENRGNAAAQKDAFLVEVLTTERLVLLLVFVTAALGLTGYSDDVFLHLATGKHIVITGALPEGDPFSFTRPGVEWVMHQWLYQVGLYLVYANFGFTGLKLLGATLLLATLFLNRKSCELLGTSTIVSWGTIIILMLVWVGFVSVRPHTITYLFFALTLHALLRYRYLGSRRLLYVLPLLMPVWVNSHGGFIIGIVVVGYYLALHVVETRLSGTRGRSPWLLLAILLAMIIASLFNPYGYKQLLFPFIMMDQWAIGLITEWQPLNVGSWQGILYLSAVALTLGTLALVAMPERLFRLAVMLPFAIAAFQAMRHLPIAVLMLGPFLSHQAGLLLEHVKMRRARQSPERVEMVRAHGELGSLEYHLNWGVLGSVILILLLTHPAYTAYVERTIKANYPIGATRYLVEHQVEGRMFTNMEYSTYILFARLPQQKLFYDVRVEMYGDELAKDYITMVYALEGWERLFEKHAIDYAVLDKDKPIYDAIGHGSSFVMVYEDEASAIFVKDPDKWILKP